MDLRRWATTFAAASVMLLLGAEAALAQGKGRDKADAPHKGPPPPEFFHDRGAAQGPPHGGVPPGKASQVGLSADAVAAVAAAAEEIGAALASHAFRPAPHLELTSRTQTFLHDVLTGEVGGTALARALERPENRRARGEARALTASLHGLLLEPAALPEAVVAFNAFVMASSEDFLTEPPEEFLAIHAALERLSVAAEEGAGATAMR